VNGGAQCWGNNDFGQLGNGDPANAGSPTPVAVSTLSSGLQAISAGGFHSCAVVNGAARCWGDNQNGELGNGVPGGPRLGDSNVPVQVTGLTSGVQAIAAGGVHTCALVNGGVQCWGDNSVGQLGTGVTSTTPSRGPVAVPTLTSGVQAITAGTNHTCALLTDGTLRCWGDNTFGQLGLNSDQSAFPTPSVVTIGAGSLNMIVTGHHHTCADSQGTVWCWGVNDLGEVGVDPTVNGNRRPAPTVLSGLSVSRVPTAALHVLPATAVLVPPDLVVTASSTVDTTALTINGVASPYLVRQGNYAVLFASGVSVQAPVQVTGSSPLIVVASSDISVASTIDVSAHGTVAGPGAATSGVGVGGAGATQPPIDFTRWSTGGGGGGYLLGGANGGPSTISLAVGVGGQSWSSSNIADPLIGGAPGGPGGFAFSGGGGGGGALQLSSATTIQITGGINAGGGGGRGGGSGQNGGGGGGAGGEVILEAPSVTAGVAVTVNGGGGGGGGGAGGSGPQPGADGQSGQVGFTPAVGGVGGVPQGCAGGNGAFFRLPNTPFIINASPGPSCGNSKGGGGGGGLGRIWLRCHPAPAPCSGPPQLVTIDRSLP
jgi:hypothetical protein